MALRAYYSAYVRHCLRFYAKYPEPEFRTEADRKDWNAVKTVFDGLESTVRNTVQELYGVSGENLPVKVKEISSRDGVRPDQLYHLMVNIENEVAKARGLI